MLKIKNFGGMNLRITNLKKDKNLSDYKQVTAIEK